jgi:hypothetical protein
MLWASRFSSKTVMTYVKSKVKRFKSRKHKQDSQDQLRLSIPEGGEP